MGCQQSAVEVKKQDEKKEESFSFVQTGFELLKKYDASVISLQCINFPPPVSKIVWEYTLSPTHKQIELLWNHLKQLFEKSLQKPKSRDTHLINSICELISNFTSPRIYLGVHAEATVDSVTFDTNVCMGLRSRYSRLDVKAIEPAVDNVLKHRARNRQLTIICPIVVQLANGRSLVDEVGYEILKRDDWPTSRVRVSQSALCMTRKSFDISFPRAFEDFELHEFTWSGALPNTEYTKICTTKPIIVRPPLDYIRKEAASSTIFLQSP